MDMTFEKEWLEQVKSVLNDEIRAIKEETGKLEKDINVRKREIWQEGPHHIRDFDDISEINLLSQELGETDKKYYKKIRQASIYEKMLNSPYFGRVDFTEDGYEEERIYVGLNSLSNDSTYDYYVYDWRAPISSLFYDCMPGRAGFKTPNGEIAGELTLKRQFIIDGGELECMFDSDVKIDDLVLKIELSKGSDSKLKTIISTIQKKQNSAIRCDMNGNVIVFGKAGSGKTSVGLHRLVYLLYTYKDRVNSGNIRIFSSNHIFNSYIANIIPELGEEDIARRDFKDLIDERMGSRFKYSDMYEQMEYLLAGHENDVRTKGIRIKYSPEFISFLEEEVKNYRAVFKDLVFHGMVICRKEELEELFKDRTSISTLVIKHQRIEKFLLRRYAEFFEENYKQIQTVLYEHDLSYHTDEDCEYEFEKAKTISLNEIRKTIIPGTKWLYLKFLRKYLRKNRLDMNIVEATEESMMSGQLYFEDILALMYTRTLTGQIERSNDVKHILIDEAQDMNLLQHLIIKRLFPESKYTILADVNQAILPDINITDKNVLAGLYGSGQKNYVIDLDKSYRSTIEISKFASDIIGIFKEDEFFDRHGKPVELLKASGSKNAKLLEILNSFEISDSVGIITKTVAEAKALFKAIRNDVKLSLISDADDEFQRGIVVIPVSLAKGLEFDRVIIPSYSEPYTDGDKFIMYLMCTRALHELYLIET